MADQESLFKSDPKNYRAMGVPHEGADAANAALVAFARDVEEARKKHRIRDVLVTVQMVVDYSDDEQETAVMTRFSFGDVSKNLELAAYAYGAESAEHRERINKFATGKIGRTKAP